VFPSPSLHQQGLFSPPPSDQSVLEKKLGQTNTTWTWKRGDKKCRRKEAEGEQEKKRKREKERRLQIKRITDALDVPFSL